MQRHGKYYRCGSFCAPLLAALLACLTLAAPAVAAQLSLVPSLTVRQEYNDNLFFDATEERDWVTTVAPGLALERNTERLKLQTTARLDGLKYLDHAELDAVEQDYRGSAQWRYSPLLSVNGEIGYLRDFRSDRDLEETGLVISPTRRDQQRYGLGLEYALAERFRLNAGWAFSREKFPGENELDSDSHKANLGLSYEVTERLQSLASLSYSHSDYLGSRLDNLMLQTGVGYAGSEKLNLQVLAGARYTRSRFEEFVPFFFVDPDTGLVFQAFEKQDAETEDWGWVASATASWQGEFSRASLSLQREVRLASGRTGSTEVTSLTVNGQRRLSEQLALTFSGGYYLNQAEAGEFGGEAIDERTLRLSPGLRYQWTPDLFTELNYAYTVVDDREVDAEYRRNLVFIQLTYRYPMEF